MTLEIFTCDQYSAEWWACRLGLPTASEFHTVLAKGRTKGEESVTRRKYINRLASEQYRGEVCEDERYSNHHLERGRAMEAEAAEIYAFTHEVELESVGFYRNNEHGTGCSPDRRIKSGGLLSIKTALPSIITDYIRRDTFPAEHRAQSQGELWITGEPFTDLVIYWPGMPLFVKRCEPDADYIAILAREIQRFNADLRDAVSMLRRYGRSLKQDLADSLISHDELMGQLKEAPAWAPR